MMNRWNFLLLLLAVFAGSVFTRSCDDDSEDINALQQEQRFFDIYRAANYPDAVQQGSGIYYLENKEGSGKTPGDTSWLLINHVSYTLPDDQVYETYLENVAFDNRIHDTAALYGPYKIQNGVINEGFTEGLKLMREGGAATFLFTSELGYGSNNSLVGSYRSLKYEVELLEVIDDIINYEANKLLAYTDTIDEVQMALDTIEDVFMFYVVDESTDGAPVGVDSTIQVAYKGYLTDGRVFDESAEGSFYQFKVGDFEAETSPISGWHLGLKNFKEGEKGRLIIPYSLAYGELGKYTQKNNVSIPPYETLVFDVEVVNVDADDELKPGSEL
jgi:FKBP-type peptidyl-prolyl cis-trans isomerase